MDVTSISNTDFDILNLCSSNRETPKNLAAHLNISNSYASSSLTKHRKLGYVTQPGPADKSGMYITTHTGEIALSKRDKYDSVYHDEWIDLIDRTRDITDRHDINTELAIGTSSIAHHLIRTADTDTISAQTVRDAAGDELGQARLAALYLYELWFFNVIISDSDGPPVGSANKYRLTKHGKQAVRVAQNNQTESIDELHEAFL